MSFWAWRRSQGKSTKVVWFASISTACSPQTGPPVGRLLVTGHGLARLRLAPSVEKL
jgi:hypothetical protein